MFEPKVRNEQTDLLMESILQLNTVEDAYRYFEDLCTIAEVKSMAQRVEEANKALEAYYAEQDAKK